MVQIVHRLPTKDRVGGRVLKSIHYFWLSTAGVVAVDLASKSIVFGALGGGAASPEQPFDGIENAVWVLPKAFRLVCHYNTGGAFGLASGNLFLFLAAAAILIPALVLTAYHCQDPRAPSWSLGLVVGGALGNLYDRLFHVGVRDFFEVINPRTGSPLWPVFNVADIAIVFGVAVYLVWSLIDTLRGKNRGHAPCGVGEDEAADPADE